MATSATDRSLDAELTSCEFLTNPYPIYARLRAERPVFWSRAWECWVVSSYSAASVVLRSDGQSFSTRERIAALLERFSSEERERLAGLQAHYSVGLLYSDPADHSRLRAIINRIFTPRSVAARYPRIEEIANGLADDLAGMGRDAREIDLVEGFALALPVAVAAEVLGIPLSRATIDEWIRNSQRFVSPPVRIENALRMQRSLKDAHGFLLDVASVKRRKPSGDVISELTAAMDAGHMSTGEFLSTCMTLVIGSYQTTAGLVSSGMLHLLSDRRQFELLRSRQVTAASAVEEFVRFETPGRQVVRAAAEATELDGTEVAAGDPVLLLLGAANRDDAQFHRAGEFDIGRQPNRHLGYAIGAHHCIGAPLARLEGAVSVRVLLDRFPDMRLGVLSDNMWTPSVAIRLLRRLPVVLSE